MNRTFSHLFILTLVALSLASCSKKEEDMTPVQPGETVTFKDQVFHFSFKAPKSWTVESVPGKATTYYSSAAAETRFQKFTEGDYGARVGVGVDEHSTKENSAAQFRQSMDGITFGQPTPTTLGGLPALKVTYVQSGEDGLDGYRIFTDKDSTVTYFDAATFGEQRMKKYAPIFEMSEKSVQPAIVLTMKNGKYDSAAMNAMMEQMKPSDNFATYTGSGYSIQYPDNFHANTVSGGVQIMGERPDAMVRVDVLTAPMGVNLDQFVAANTKQYHSSPQSTTLGGQPARMFSYGTSDATARAYFVMSGTKVYRITVSWPNSLESSYRPAMEKSVQSFRAH